MDLSLDQQKLLHLVNLYTRPRTGKQRWIKELPLHVAIFHAIRRGAFDTYDFAPSLITSHGVRIYANMSQEALHDMMVLREKELVEKLKLSTHLYEDIGAYRITEAGIELAKTIGSKNRKDLNDALACSACNRPVTFRIVKEVIEGETKIRAFRGCSHCDRDKGDNIGCRDGDSSKFFTVQPVVYKTLPYLPEAMK